MADLSVELFAKTRLNFADRDKELFSERSIEGHGTGRLSFSRSRRDAEQDQQRSSRARREEQLTVFGG